MKKNKKEYLELARLGIKKDYTELYFNEVEKLEIGKRSKWKEVPPKFYPLFYLIITKKKSITKRVKAKCLDCSNYQIKKVANCIVESCPLFQIRPYQKGKK